jgi:hypothetical protein
MPTQRRLLATDPDFAFRLVTDLQRLPDWNRAITRAIARRSRLASKRRMAAR